MTEPRSDYEIGFGRPPKHSRWKKGQTGNPKRQYKRQNKGTVTLIQELFAKRVKITEDGRPRVITVFEAILTQLLLKEMSGNRRAFLVRLKYQKYALSRVSKQQVSTAEQKQASVAE